jgi:hypothetical protein
MLRWRGGTRTPLGGVIQSIMTALRDLVSSERAADEPFVILTNSGISIDSTNGGNEVATRHLCDMINVLLRTGHQALFEGRRQSQELSVEF